MHLGGKLENRIRHYVAGRLTAQLVLMCCLVFSPAYAEDDPTIVRLLTEGAEALANNDIDTAFSSFQNILILQPKHPEAHFRLGEVFSRKGDMSKAQNYLVEATRLDPFNANFSLMLGGFYERIGQKEKAHEEYQRLIDTGSRDEGVREAEKRLSLATGQALAKKGEMNAALLIFNGLILDYPDDPLILANIGATYVFLNRVEEAEDTFERLLALEPQNTIAHLNLANIYERTNRPEDAMRHFKSIIDIGGDKNMMKEARIRYGIINGREYLRRRDWSNAVKVLQEVINLDPKRTEAFFNIALANLSLGNIEMAEKGFNGVLKVDPKDYSARLNLGSLYADTGKLDQAKEQFQFVIDNDGGRYGQEAKARMNKIHTMVADRALKEGKVEESLREYEKALDFYSGNVKASFNRGLIYIKQRQFEKARVEFESVIRHSPQNVRGRMNLANVYEQIGQLSKAAEQYEIVVELDKDSREGKIASAKWRITKARGLWSEKKLSAAEKIFEEIVIDQPNNFEALYYLGTIQRSKGMLEEAAGAFQRILDLRPGNQLVRMQLAKIYEQLGLDQLAASEYQFIMFNGAAPEVLNEASVRLSSVEDRLSGFANLFNYSFLADSNANMNDAAPTREVRSDIAVSVIYSQTLLNDLSYKLILSPSYSTFFVSQSDYLNSNISASIIKGSPRRNFTINYGQQNQSALNVETDLSRSSTLSFASNRTLFLPAVFGLTPKGFEGEKISTGFALNGDVRNIRSFGLTGLNSYTGTAGVTFNQSLAKGIRASAGYSLVVNWIPEASHKLIQEENKAVVETEDGNQVIVNQAGQDLITYDSRDYEYAGHNFSVTVNRILGPGVGGSISTSAMYIGYLNDDSGSVVAGVDQKRKNLNLTLSVSLTYAFFKDINFFITGIAQKNYSSLPTGFTSQSTSEANSTFQSTSLGSLMRFSMTSGLRMSF